MKVNKSISKEIAQVLGRAVSYALEQAFNDMVDLNDDVEYAS